MLVFAGNGNGIIGYGKGRALEPDKAMKNAFRNLKRNLIILPLDHYCTVTKRLFAK